MVGFFIDLNGKTNHKFPHDGIRKGRKIRTQRKSTVPGTGPFRSAPFREIVRPYGKPSVSKIVGSDVRLKHTSKVGTYVLDVRLKMGPTS